MSRAKRTMMNAMVSGLNLVVSGGLSLVVNRLLLAKLGSDYNGANSVIAQSLAVLTLLEGGFGLASLVALFKPYTSGDMNEMNAILSTTRKSFARIGAHTLIAGVVISIVFPLIIKTTVPYSTLVALYLFSLVPLSFNFAFVLKFRLIFQVSQTEYIVGFINLVTTVLIQAFSIIILVLFPSIIAIRAVHAILSVLSGLVIARVAYKQFPALNFSLRENRALIKGTRDVFVGNLTSYFYSSSTVLFLSIFVGTTSTSVYAVYNSVMVLVTQAVHIVLQSPQNALGQVIAEGNSERTSKVFSQFEYIAVLAVAILFSTTYSLILPFVSIYTSGVQDAEYISNTLPLLLTLVSVTELVHIPSGLCINLHGRFKVIRNIQLAASILIVVASIAGALSGGLMGIIIAKLLTAAFLAVIEITYVRTKILGTGMRPFFQIFLPNALVAAALGTLGKYIIKEMISNYREFVIYAIIVFVSTALLMIIMNRIFYKQQFQEVVKTLNTALSSHSEKEH